MTRLTKAQPQQTWISRGKDIVLFVGGITGMVWEAGIVAEPRAILVTAYLLALGLPVFNSIDRLFQRPGAAEEPPPNEGGQA